MLDFTEIRDCLSRLKFLNEDQGSHQIRILSSELMGKVNRLVAQLLEQDIEESSVPDILSNLEERKEFVFILIEVFGLIFQSKRNQVGQHIQSLVSSIYDCANEGKHYVKKDEVFVSFNKIDSIVARKALDVFSEVKGLGGLSFFSDTFMPWLNGISAPIRKAVKQYFRDECKTVQGHSVSRLAFEPKERGVQIGTRAIVNFSDDHPPMTFYVKVHQNYVAYSGRASGSQGKKIDFKELFVYKVLERIGLCSQVHFITNQKSEDRFADTNTLFIATRDAAYTKYPKIDSSAEGKTKFFQPMRALYTKDDRLRPVGDQPFLGQFRLELAHSGLGPLKQVATLFDFLARTFRLDDLNEDNFGRVSVTAKEQGYDRWVFFDFCVPKGMEGRYVIADEVGVVEGFISGNGSLRHPASFLSDAVMMRTREEKIEIGNHVCALLEEGRSGHGSGKNKMPFLEAMEHAFVEVKAYMEQPLGDSIRAVILGVDLEKSLFDLEDYKNSAIKNFEFLKSGLLKLSVSLGLRSNP